jgi:hypothetical protein
MIKMMNKIFMATVFSLLLVGHVSAQVTGKTIQWKVESVMDIVKGTPTSQFGDVITYPSKIEFLPAKGAAAQTVQTYTITKTDTSWTDLMMDGSVVFQVMSGDKKGMVSIKRINGKLWITLTIFALKDKALLDFKCAGYEIITQK